MVLQCGLESLIMCLFVMTHYRTRLTHGKMDIQTFLITAKTTLCSASCGR